jgi:hypothetical protein
MPSLPKKYIPKGLRDQDKKIAENELKKSRKLYKQGKYHTRKKVKSFNTKKSKHIIRAEKLYKTKIVPTKKLAKKTKCKLSALHKIVKKGQGAYYSSGSRPNQSAHSWGYARLASSISGGKAAAVDFSIIESGCKKQGRAYKYAVKSRKNHGNGTRRVPKYK